MMPARRAPSPCQAKRASSGPGCRSLGHTRNTHGLNPDRSGLDAEGEIIATGLAPAPYTRAAAIVVPDERCPTTATTVGSAYSCSATRTAVSSLPESSATRSSSGRPRTPRLALIWFTASWAARSMDAPRGWEKGPARPMVIGRVRRGRSLVQMEPSRALYRFAGALEPLLVAPDAAAFERAWDAAHLDRLAWEALALARRANSAALEPALHAVDRRLLAVLERCRSFLDPH